SVYLISSSSFQPSPNGLSKSPIDICSIVTLSSGIHYTISVKVGKDKVTIEQISMGDFDSPFGDGWNDEEEIK
ncbi:MAG: hypothetical protein J6J22_01430, partial [Alistipes sp.]|nr:hypothetical protein [Alistipes sp.]